MSRISYVNGHYVRQREAAVAIEDRGYQFADAVYEVLAYFGEGILDLQPHLTRLRRSLAELAMPFDMSDQALGFLFGEVIRRNRFAAGSLYLQVSRGVAPRDHAFPRPGTLPALVINAKRMDVPALLARQKKGVAVITHDENRWARPDIKSTSLLANVVAKQAAREQGGFEGWFVDADGTITEGTSSTAWMITNDGQIVTRALDGSILPGITRAAVLEVAMEQGLALVERAFSADEAKTAAELFLTSTTSFVCPVVSIDGAGVSGGKPGPVATRLVGIHWDHVKRETGFDVDLYDRR